MRLCYFLWLDYVYIKVCFKLSSLFTLCTISYSRLLKINKLLNNNKIMIKGNNIGILGVRIPNVIRTRVACGLSAREGASGMTGSDDVEYEYSNSVLLTASVDNTTVKYLYYGQYFY